MKSSEFEKCYKDYKPVKISKDIIEKLRRFSDVSSVYDDASKKFPAAEHVSRGGADEDIRVFFELLKYSYAGYDYYKDICDFDKIRDELIASVPESGLSSGELKKRIHSSLKDIINDTHFSFAGTPYLEFGHLFRAYFSDIVFEKRGDKLTVISEGELHGKMFGPSEISDENLFLTLPSPSGAARFLFGEYTENPSGALELCGISVPLHVCRTDEITENNVPLYDEETLGVPTVYHTSYVLDPSKLSEFSDMGTKYSGAKNLIWSVMNNRGGASGFPEAFTKALSGYANWELELAELISPLFEKENENADEKRYSIFVSDRNDPSRSGFEGKLYLLQNKRVSSSGEAAIMYARSVKNSVTVGSASCGCGQFGDVKWYRLPNSNICFLMGFKVFNMTGFTEGRGILPDYWIDSADPAKTVAEYINSTK